MDLQSNCLNVIPISLFEIKTLSFLNLKHNCITQLPNKINSRDSNLYSLDLSFNPITTLPEWIADLSKLKKLNIYQTKIKNIPEFLQDRIDNNRLQVYFKSDEYFFDLTHEI